MSIAVETLDGLKRRLTLNLDATAVEAEIKKRLAKVARTVRMDGFRPGKAPLAMVSARYGGEVRGEVLGEQLHDRFFNGVQEAGIKVAGYPRFEAAGADGHAFHATFEVFPEIAPGDLGQIKINRPVATVSDADIDRTLEVLRKQRLHYQSVDRPAQKGDRVHVDYRGTVDGEVFPGGEGKDLPVVLGEGRTLPEFEGALDGMAAGSAKTFNVTFPDDYFAKDLAGKTAEFSVSVGSVHAPHLPELDESFATSLGIKEGVTQLRDEVGANLGREVARRIQARVKEQVMDGLLQVTSFEVPESLVQQEQQDMLNHAVNDLKQRGMRDQDIKLTADLFTAQAKRRVSLGLLLAELARQNGIKADVDRVRAKVEEFSKSYEDPSEVVTWYYSDPKRLAEVESLVLEDALVDWVLERAQVSDDAQSVEKLMGSNG